MSVFIAIDLGNSAAKVTALKRVGRAWVFDAYYSEPVVSEGVFVTEAERLVALDTLLEAHPGWSNQSTESALVWPAERATLHRMTVPFTDADQVTATLPFAVEGEVPFELDEMVLGYRTLTVSSTTEVLVTLVSKARLKNTLDVLSARGVHPTSVMIDGDSTAIWTPKESVLNAVIDVGHVNSIVSLVRDGTVVMARAINAGGADFTRAIMRVTGGTFEEAERLKHSGALSAEAQVGVKQELDVLLGAIRTTLITGEDTLGLDVKQVHLTGGGAQLSGLSKLLQSDLGLPVSPIVNGVGELIPPAFTASHALAMHGTGDGRGDPIELRIGELAYKGGVDVLKTGVLLIASGLLFFSLAAGALFGYRFVQLGNDVSKIEDQIVSLVSTTLPDVPAVTTTSAMPLMLEAVQAAQARARVLKSSDEPPMATVFLKLAKVLPSPESARIKVKTLKLTPAALNFTAETTDYDASASIESALKASAFFKLSEKSNEKKVRDTVQFNISVPLDGSEGDKD